jgi:hypothetical protein
MGLLLSLTSDRLGSSFGKEESHQIVEMGLLNAGRGRRPGILQWERLHPI